MTGQVKEEILTRFGELGIRVSEGRVRIRPALLRSREFVRERREFCYLDVDGNWQNIAVPAHGLAFTWCQVPVIYSLDDGRKPSLTITRNDGSQETTHDLALSAADSTAIFERSGRLRSLHVVLNSSDLFAG
jgi:hypothetical protein